MSLTDIVSSICTMLGRLPAPPDIEYNAGLGSETFCAVQGFFYQSILSTVAYNSGLAIYFLLLVRYKWKEDEIVKVERWIHVFAISIFLISATVLASLKLFNPAYFICFIESVPRDCNDENPCVRGIYPNTMRWIFFYGPIWTMIAAVTIIMVLMYSTVLIQEKRMDKFIFRGKNPPRRILQRSMSEIARGPSKGRNDNSEDKISSHQTSSNRKNREMSRQVAVQGMWYLVPFYLTWVFPMLTHAFGSLGVDGVNMSALLYLITIFMPLQGFMNWLVYLRPRVLKWWNSKGRQSMHESALFSSFRSSRVRSNLVDLSNSFMRVGKESKADDGRDDDRDVECNDASDGTDPESLSNDCEAKEKMQLGNAVLS